MADRDYYNFAAKVDHFTAKVVPEQANIVKQKIALDLLTGVVMLIRVDTGRARGGWQVSLRSPSDRETGRLDKVGTKTIAHGTRTIESVKPWDDIYLNNPVVYAAVLNDGDEHRTGDHMVERTLARVGAQH